MRTLSHGVLSRLQNLPGAAVFAGVLDAILRPLARSSAGAHVAARLSGLGPSKIRQSSAAKTGSASTTSQSTAGSTLPIIDLASGAPSFSTPADLKDAAVEAINANHNQYAHPNGDAELRRLIAAWAGHTAGRIIDADREVTVTSGTSAALAACLLISVERGDEVIVFEPFFESYVSAIRFAGGVPRFVPLLDGSWTIDRERLEAAFNRRTRAVIVNSPHNPTGRTFSADELELIASLCERYGCLLISDEIYAPLVYDGDLTSVPPSASSSSVSATPGTALPGITLNRAPSALACRANRERTMVIDGLSKAYSVTGWRVGYVIAPQFWTDHYRTIQSVLGLSAPTPFMVAARTAFAPSVLAELAEAVEICRQGRDIFCQGLAKAGFRFVVPEGATYVFADVSSLGAADDSQARDRLFELTGITSVPGFCFFQGEPEPSPSSTRRQYLRFCFARDLTTLREAADRLAKLANQP